MHYVLLLRITIINYELNHKKHTYKKYQMSFLDRYPGVQNSTLGLPGPLFLVLVII